MTHDGFRWPENRRQTLLALALSATLLLPGLAAAPALAGGGSEPGSGQLPVPGDWGDITTPVAFVDLDLLRYHFDCIFEPPPPDPIGPVVTLIAQDWDGDRVEEIGGFDQQSCQIIQPANLCSVLEGPDPQPWDPDPVSWNVVAGDWNGDGQDTLAVFDLGSCTTLPLDRAGAESLILPEVGTWRFLAGDWDGSGAPSIAMARPYGLSGEESSALFAGRWNGEVDSLAAVDGEGEMIPLNLDVNLASAFETDEVLHPAPGEACLDFEIECWDIAFPGVGTFKLCLRRRCCLGQGCYEYLDKG